jgi:[ribosomal protein S5]-alanine N-acetyltransferase
MTPDVLLPLRSGFIRTLTPNDVHTGYVHGLNDPDVNRYLEVRHKLQTHQTVSDFIFWNRASTNALLLGIFLHNQSKHIGTIRLHDIDLSLGHCHIGICIFEKSAWGIGIGTDAIKSVTRWAFFQLGLHSIEAHAYLDNIASIRSFEQAGFLRSADNFKSLPSEAHPVQHAVLVSSFIQ